MQNLSGGTRFKCYPGPFSSVSYTTIEEANGVVDKLTADKVSQYVTDWRKVADAEISKANQTYENGLKEKYDFVEKGKQTPPTPPTPPASGAITLDAISKLIDEKLDLDVWKQVNHTKLEELEDKKQCQLQKG